MNWGEMISYSAEKNRLKVLSTLWNIQEANAHKISNKSQLPYTTTSRILLQLYSAGLLYRTKQKKEFRYGLNSKGSLIAAILIESHFTKASSEIRIIKCEEGFFIGRKEELDNIHVAVEKKIHTLVTGPYGIGKTALLLALKELYKSNYSVFYSPEPKPIKTFLVRLANHLGIEVGIATPTWDVLEEIKSKTERLKKPLLLLTDDIDDVTKTSAKELSRIMQFNNIIVIAAGVSEPVKYQRLYWEFKNKLQLKPLTQEETKTLIKSRMNEINPDKNPHMLRQIYLKTKGIPEAVVNFLEDLEREDKNDINKIKPHPSAEVKKIDLLPVIAFIAIAYLFLAFRYVALAGRSREFYLFAGATGFILLAILRFYMYRKRYG